MNHAIHRVTDFEIVGPYSLRVSFEDGMSRGIDLEPLLEGELYGPLRDPDLFKGVHIDSEVGTLVWPNGADFDPATLYDWPKVAEELTAMAQGWRMATETPEKA
ncbi:DUF2442 domain-containing protein [Candidatus Thiosymbion oneisti]|uniref:DUF2442 domain-containing protein n=1 Tax=Candidatus Thiosymbion oneisti TaxID=589554 RepID=UPI000AB7C809|nr:DUF2442 domain-containing protein [Candidatus Thiosymbion oneisti]